MAVTKKCEACGGEFSIPLRRSEKVRFCSWACKTKGNTVERACEFCRGKFSVYASVTNARFCSRRCRGLSMRKPESGRSRHRQKQVPAAPTVVKCEMCGTDFRVPPYRADTAATCSIQCKSKVVGLAISSAQPKGEDHPRWRGGIYKRGDGYVREGRRPQHRVVMERWLLEDASDHPFLAEGRLRRDIDVHHIDLVRNNNERSNLVAIVGKAHDRLHSGNIVPEPYEMWPVIPPDKLLAVLMAADQQEQP